MRDSGFTIVEALIALAILAAGLVALYSAGAGVLKTTGHTSRAERAFFLAQDKLGEISLTRGPLPARDEGDIPEGNMHWQLISTDSADENQGPGQEILQDVTVTVTWRDGLTRHTQSFATRHLATVIR